MQQSDSRKESGASPKYVSSVIVLFHSIDVEHLADRSLTVAWMANDCLESIALELVVCVGSVIWMLEWIDAHFYGCSA